MARHCVRWASGRKSKKVRGRRGGKKICRFGKVKRGRRKGQCLKAKRAKKRRVNTAKRGRYIFHGR